MLFRKKFQPEIHIFFCQEFLKNLVIATGILRKAASFTYYLAVALLFFLL